jgi:hypothetical protein
MLFSLNLTLLRQKNRVLTLEQTLRFSSRGVSKRERAEQIDRLCAALTQIGLEVEDRRCVLGTFDAQTGQFRNYALDIPNEEL